MATVEHCLYCFEALAAHLERREPMTLAEVQKSWAEYARSVEAGAADGDGDTSDVADADSSSNIISAKRLPALRRLAASSDSSTSSPSLSSASASASTSTLSLGPDTPATSVSSASTLGGGEEQRRPPPEPVTITESPLFVTWNTLSARHGRVLRGCIGTFEAQELEDGLASYALISALQDMRFRPVSLAELPSLEVAVTLLTDFEEARDAFDWELGRHGLRISFQHHGKRYGSTYLPDVAVEQGWDKEETVVSLMRKAGWVGRRDKWAEVDLKVVRYQGRKESLEYGEYKRWREWVEKSKK